MNNAERRLHDAKLGAAIDDAAESLPEGCQILLSISDGALSVDLLIDDAYTEFPEALAIHEQIRNAVQTAKQYRIDVG